MQLTQSALPPLCHTNREGAPPLDCPALVSAPLSFCVPAEFRFSKVGGHGPSLKSMCWGGVYGPFLPAPISSTYGTHRGTNLQGWGLSTENVLPPFKIAHVASVLLVSYQLQWCRGEKCLEKMPVPKLYMTFKSWLSSMNCNCKCLGSQERLQS